MIKSTRLVERKKDLNYSLEQFDKLIDKLEEIRCGLIDVEDSGFKNNPVERAFEEQIQKIRTAFYHQLEAKTELVIGLESELTEWKSLYGEVFDTKKEYDASLKEIADLLFLKNMPIGMSQTSFSKEKEGLTKEDFSNIFS